MPVSFDVKVDLAQLGAAENLLQHLADVKPRDILQVAVPLVESQTRRRIETEKTAPDGTPWPDWSPAYAAERPSGASLLESSGALLDSISSSIEGDVGIVGSNKVYARIQNDGGKTRPHKIKPRNKKALAFGGRGPFGAVNHPGSNIPARQFLGASDANKEELGAEVLEFYRSKAG